MEQELEVGAASDGFAWPTSLVAKRSAAALVAIKEGIIMNTVTIRMQIHEAVESFPTISSMDELWALPQSTLLIAGDKVWDASAYLTAQGMSSARNGGLFTGTARVLWIP